MIIRKGVLTCVAVLLAGVAAAQPLSPLAEARTHVGDADINVVTFRAMDAFFPSAPVAAGRAAKLPERRSALSPEVRFADGTAPFEAALDRTYTNALLVLRDGAIVDERYRNGSGPDSRFTSWSVAKSITSILIGIALDKGMIASVAEPADKYAPALKGTAFEGATIEDLLTMRDGTSYTEQVPNGESTLDRIKRRSSYANFTGFSDVTGLDLTRLHAPGTHFNYSTLTSSLLARVVEGASGMTLAAFTEKYLWKPAGMEASAYWQLDRSPPEGLALGGSGFNATLRDFGRIGQLMLDGGRANGKQIVSKAWVEKSTRHFGGGPVIPGAPRGYGYQWWTMLGTDRFEAIGIHGQFVSVDPATRTVIVKLSHWPEKGGHQLTIETLALLDAVRGAVSAQEGKQ
ncbi:serine hydrolase domain-containing protein [Sphingosinicella microcystinivorans]|uniref:serine hydrolase domain-containing protein n=1 Tax=Sphingosinicella microcystinivorans TaxID=335406 RepID=UPI0022F3E883|nr:serine hydrolase [Sphingosinicella microcystinivorans]WBX84269.1 serine hydrolase [Sphingosinicella microcystinivorans]